MRTLALAFLGLLAAQPAGAETMTISQGGAKAVTGNLSRCGGRPVRMGEIVAGGKKFRVPADTAIMTGPRGADLYNRCTGVTPRNISEVDIDRVPVTEIDSDGEVISGLIFADNYFELFVNGKLIAVDPNAFTPFNSVIVRFRAKRPVTYAFRLVDWEENLGLGTEAGRGSRFHPGDGGLAASFSDGTRTDGSWKARAYYIAPIADRRTAEKLADRNSAAVDWRRQRCGTDCFAVHFDVPDGWMNPAFDDGGWRAATVFTNETVGVRGKPSYTNFEDQFIGAGAKFIWSRSLVLDNHVLVRKTVP